MQNSDLKRVGLKITIPRVRIMEILDENRELHMSAEGVYRALLEAGDEVGIATVYRVLMQFETAGLVVRHNFEGGHAVYELDSGGHHDHIVCLDCGRVTEFIDETIEKKQRAIADRNGFELADHSLVLYGRCAQTRCPHRHEAS
jgi:Fur family transcriptional regulator, ferric uptake regulator